MPERHSYRILLDNKKIILDDKEYDVHIVPVKDDSKSSNIYIYSIKKQNLLLSLFSKDMYEFPFFLKDKKGLLSHCDNIKLEDSKWLHEFIDKCFAFEMQLFYSEQKFIKDLAGSI